MKKKLLLITGIAGMFLGTPVADTKAEVSIHIGGREPRAPFVISHRPDFVNLPGFGFAVSVGGPYDMIFYNNFYYVNYNGGWYRASDYRGPWVRDGRLPYKIKKHRWEDIRRSRDEYRSHNRRFDDRFDRRDEPRRDDRNPRFDDNRRDGNIDNRNVRDPRLLDNRQDQRTPNTPPKDNKTSDRPGDRPGDRPNDRPNDGVKRN